MCFKVLVLGFEMFFGFGEANGVWSLLGSSGGCQVPKTDQSGDWTYGLGCVFFLFGGFFQKQVGFSKCRRIFYNCKRLWSF